MASREEAGWYVALAFKKVGVSDGRRKQLPGLNTWVLWEREVGS